MVDVSGLVVAPGFIDIHTHARRGIFEIPTADNYVRQGVTTLVEGPDGGSDVPLQPFLERVATARLTPNFATFIGQGSIRSEVVGSANRAATAEELERMRGLVRQGMEQGAFGLSSGLFYVPGTFTPTDEVVELAKVAGRMGGIYISHMRDEAGGVVDSVRETIAIGERGGLPTQVTHHKVIGKKYWGRSVDTLKLIDEARARGVDATIDMYPYTASSTSIQAALLPAWAQEGGRTALMKRLDDPATREKIKAESATIIRDERGGGDPQKRRRVELSLRCLTGRKESRRDHRQARAAGDHRERRRDRNVDGDGRRMPGDFSRHQRGGSPTRPGPSRDHDRVGWGDSNLRTGGAASAQLWNVRARARPLRS